MNLVRKTSRTLILAGVFSSVLAHAELQDDVKRLLRQAERSGTVYHLGPRILEQGEELPLLLPPEITSAGGPECAHVIVLAAQSIHFTCELTESEADDQPSAGITSRAGLVELVRCGKSRQQLANVSVTMFSMRGPIDVIAFSAPSMTPIASGRLPNRSTGAEAPERTLTREPELPRLGAWLTSLEANALAEGATRTERRTLPTQDKDVGETLVGFDPGCHEVQLLADVDWEAMEGAGAGVDLVWQDDGELAARGTLHTRSPTLRVCTAHARTGQLRFPALPQSVAGVLFRARYAWPEGIPSYWTTPMRNRIAQALVQKRMKLLAPAPVKAWLGSGAPVALKIPLAPHACYVVIVASTTALLRDINLEVVSGARQSTDSTLDDGAASVAFCQNTADSVAIDVDARESSTTWIMGLWNVATLPSSPDLR